MYRTIVRVSMKTLCGCSSRPSSHHSYGGAGKQARRKTDLNYSELGKFLTYQGLIIKHVKNKVGLSILKF